MKKLKGKLRVNKKTISVLSDLEMSSVVGGSAYCGTVPCTGGVGTGTITCTCATIEETCDCPNTGGDPTKDGCDSVDPDNCPDSVAICETDFVATCSPGTGCNPDPQ